MKKTGIIYLIFLICFSVTVFAETTTTMYRLQNQNNNISIACSSSYAPCSNITECNLSVYNEKGQILINNQLMTKLNNTYYYETQFTTTGQHEAVVFCSNTDYTGKSQFNIMVLEDNYNFGNSNLLNSNVLIGLFGAMVIFLIIFLFNKNIVMGFISATFGIISSLVIWTQGINIVTFDYPILIYYKVPVLLSSSIGFIMVLFSTWLYWYSANFDQNKQQEQTVEYDYREEI